VAPGGALAEDASALAEDVGALAEDVVATRDAGALAVEAPGDAVALARALLPIVPHPAKEYDLPVLQVER
jgi:hypothetical protein